MKKVLITVFALGMLLVSSSANATSVWNGASNDCPGLSVANYSTNTGIVQPCWPLKTVSANDGDSINIRIYYHNTSTVNATNVRFTLNASTGASSTHSFSGQIVSDQGSLSLGSVTVSTPSGSTLTFSSAHWLPDQNQTDSPIPNGQSSTGTEILGGGLNIGTVAPGWDHQGSVVVAFRVSSPVNPPANTPTGTLTSANDSCSIPAGQSNCQINFSWNTNNPVGTSAITRDGGPTVATGNSGSKAFTIPYSSATFRLYNNALELASKTVSSYCTSGTSWNGSACVQNVDPTYSCSVTNFTVGGSLSTTITSGSPVVLAWTTTGCDYVNIPDVGTNLPANSSYTVSPTYSRSYTVTGYGSSSTNSTRTVSVTVNNQYQNTSYVCHISSFGADNTNINQGDSTRLTWSTENCNYVNIPGVGSNLSKNGSYRVNPGSTRSYSINAYGNNGSDSNSVTIYVNNYNNYNNCNYYNNCNNNNNNYNTPSVSTYSPSNVVDTSANISGFASGNGSQINTWLEFPCYGSKYSYNTNVSSASLSYQVGNLAPNTTYNYCAVAQNVYNSQIIRGNTVSFTTTGSTYQQPPVVYLNKNVVTTVATNITKNSAQLNGYITNSSYYNSNTHFEYGTTVNLGLSTTAKTTVGNSTMTDTVYGLSPNTIYFFQAVATGPDGETRGSIQVFKTLSDTVVKPVIIQGTTVVGTSSPVMLDITNKYQAIGAGDTVDYMVTYKNIGKVKLTKPMIQVVLPTNITLVNSSQGTYAVDTHTLSTEIPDLAAGQGGVIYLQGRVDSVPLNNSQIATTAILIYTASNGSQQNAMAYVLNTPRAVATTAGTTDNTSLLGGAALFGGFFSIGLVGWLIIILIILLIILVARSVYGKNQNDGNVVHPTHPTH